MWVAHSSRVRFRPATPQAALTQWRRVEIPDVGGLVSAVGLGLTTHREPSAIERDFDLVERILGDGDRTSDAQAGADIEERHVTVASVDRDQ